jgi:ribosomal protein L5
MQLPKIDKIVLNSGLGQKAVAGGISTTGIGDKKYLLNLLLALEIITGQKAKITRAKKSIDKFKLRKNMAVGAQVTLRKKSLFRYLDKLIFTVLPKFENLKEFQQEYQKRQNASAGKKLVKKKNVSTLEFYNPSRKKAFCINKKNWLSSTHSFSSKNGLGSSLLSYTVAFGISGNDFFLFQDIPYDKLDSLSLLGFDNIISLASSSSASIYNIDPIATPSLLMPTYYLTSGQMPF